MTRTTLARGLTPDTLAWKHAGDNLQLLMAGTTLILQVAHPVVGAGVNQFSVFRKDPWGRLKRTTEWGLRILYGGENAPQAGQDLRHLHRDIKGQDEAGRKYFALDPEAYAWVHMTTYYTLVTSQRLFGERPFSEPERRQLYEEWLYQGEVLGIRRQDMPPTVEDFWRYFQQMIDQRLEDNEMVRYLLNTSLRRISRPPQLRWLPQLLWDGLYARAGSLALLNTLGTLPPELREKLNLDYGWLAQRRFAFWRRRVRQVLPLVPRRLRYLPPALEAFKRQSQGGQVVGLAEQSRPA